MSIEIVLFGLRIISGLLLLAILFALFALMWRDYRSTTDQLEASRRTYGQVIALARIDGKYTPLGDVYPLLPLTSIGRSPTNSIVVSTNFASSEHALIALRNGQWWLEDRNSRNGTLLNGERITTPVVITDHDIIAIGDRSFSIQLEDKIRTKNSETLHPT